MPRKSVTNDNIYDLVNQARLEQKGDLLDARKSLELLINDVVITRIAPLEVKVNKLSDSQGVIATKVITYVSIINIGMAAIIAAVLRKLWP